MSELAGQIGLVRTRGPLGWLIRAVTRSPVNHVVVAVDEVLCIGAEKSGARIRPMTHFGHIDWSSFALTDSERSGIVAWCEGIEGSPYSWIDDVAIGLEQIMHERTPRWLLRRLSATKTLQCAALADAAYVYGAGIQVFEDRRYFGCVFPGSYVAVFKAKGWL
ncbi:hypothetical protein [Cryobacterium sp. GrIS_2_6]|uniref:hypothetical protein n=1 Tax=Cryobacterium sp. GrIS_2_6 TaxID=3162785 RepID=UPI002DFE9A6E|nr:hypothetical protein [Cryobacterium psychrotolerans]MEC5149245.1 hypothetical protein [Cryobacterium psychrotolerans]MEC5149323.1 hypothetical protein [Cryobacterium psychrotolerans]